MFRRLCFVPLSVVLLAACTGADDPAAPGAPSATVVASSPTTAPVVAATSTVATVPTSGSTAASPPGPTGPGATAAGGTYRLEAGLDDVDDFVARLDRLGAEGFAFVGPVTPGFGGTIAPIGELFVQDGARRSSRLDYAVDERTVGADAWVARADARGADGYLYKGPYLVGLTQVELFVRDTTRTATYRYEALPAELSPSTDPLVAELNAQGARGFRWLGSQVSGAGAFNTYVSDGTGVTYRYEAVRATGPLGADSIEAFLTVLNSQAATGAQYLTALNVDGFAATVLVFEASDRSGQPVRTYRAEPAPAGDGLETLVARADARAAAGEWFWGEVMTNDLSMHRLFVTGATTDLRHPLTGPWYP